MAKNADYYTQVHKYVKELGMDRVDADQIATTLSVLIPLRHTFGSEDKNFRPETNQHVLDNFIKLHQGKSFVRYWPFDLGLPRITVESYNDLPDITTYGQQYRIRLDGTLLETQANGLTEIVKPIAHIQIGEPLTMDPVALAKLQQTAEQRGMKVVVTNRRADDPMNAIGLEAMRGLFQGTGLAESTEATERAEAAALRAEEHGGWSRTTPGKLHFRNRPVSKMQRLRHRGRGG